MRKLMEHHQNSINRNTKPQKTAWNDFVFPDFTKYSAVHNCDAYRQTWFWRCFVLQSTDNFTAPYVSFFVL